MALKPIKKATIETATAKVRSVRNPVIDAGRDEGLFPTQSNRCSVTRQ